MTPLLYPDVHSKMTGAARGTSWRDHQWPGASFVSLVDAVPSGGTAGAAGAGAEAGASRADLSRSIAAVSRGVTWVPPMPKKPPSFAAWAVFSAHATSH